MMRDKGARFVFKKFSGIGSQFRVSIWHTIGRYNAGLNAVFGDGAEEWLKACASA